MSTLIFLFALVATLVPSALAHGRLDRLTIDGTAYQGNTVPPSNPIPNLSTPIRPVKDFTPIQGATNPALTCGKGATIANMVVPAKPGSFLTFSWKSGPSGNGPWPHNTGPLMAYMSTCGNTTCDKFDATDAQWFKISELGQVQKGSMQWFQSALYEGKPTNLTLPLHLASGDYLLRYEILALQSADVKNGTEFYVACSQLRISAGTNSPIQPNQTVKLPGAYSDNDIGIYDPNFFNGGLNYQFPGPPVSNVVTGSSPTTAGAVKSSNVASMVKAGSRSSAAVQSSNPTMGTNATSPSVTHTPRRQLSRIMTKFKRAHLLSN